MNRVGVSFAYWAHTWEADVKNSILRAAKTKMEALEIMSGSLMEATDAHLEEIRAVAAGNGIQLTMGMTLDGNTDISSEDSGIRNAGIQRLTKVLHIMDKLDCRILGGLTYGAWGGKISSLAEKPKRVALSIDSIKKLVKVAEDLNIQYCVEIVNRFEQYLINTAAEARDFILRVDSPNAKICLDTFHMNIDEDDMAQAIRTAGDLLAHMHVGENNRRIPGTGPMDWDALIGALKEIGYNGAIVMEPFLRAGDDVGDGVALWRDLSNNATENQMDAMIMQGADFIRSKL